MSVAIFQPFCICCHSCWTQKMTSILGRSGTATAPPCWPPYRSMATPLSTWASLGTSTTYFTSLFMITLQNYLSAFLFKCIFSHNFLAFFFCPTAPMTFSTRWMKASAVLMSSSPQEEYLWERRYDGTAQSAHIQSRYCVSLTPCGGEIHPQTFQKGCRMKIFIFPKKKSSAEIIVFLTFIFRRVGRQTEGSLSR